MRTYANSSECRRVLLMKHFMETPTFSSCTNCDNCEAKSSSTEFLRDFTFECKFILGVISSSSSVNFISAVLILTEIYNIR
jgi:superfamily II DNA helicase RecQ